MTVPVASSLAEAAAAFAADRIDAGLVALVRAWRERPAPELAEAVERASTLAAAARAPVTGATEAAIDAQWRARAELGDPAELGLLLPSLTHTDSHSARRRLKALRGHAPDPRLAAALVALVLAPPYTASSTAKFWQTLHELLLACLDPRSLAELERAPALADGSSSSLDRLDAGRRRSVAGLRERLSSVVSTLDEHEHAQLARALDAMAAAEARRRDPSAELLAVVLAEPEVLGHRQVYADYLLSRGDPRGEFVALQLAELDGALDRRGQARAAALLREHLDAWLGPLRTVLVRSATRFRGGFLHRARVRHGARALDEVLTDPRWATVEVLELMPPAQLLAPTLRSVRALRWYPRHVMAAAEAGLHLPAITDLHLDAHGHPWPPGLRRAIDGLALFPGLTNLALTVAEIDLDALAWTWSGSVAERITTLTIDATHIHDVTIAACQHSLASASDAALRLSTVTLRDAQRSYRFERRGSVWTPIAQARG